VLEKLRTGPIAARALLVLLRRQSEFVQPTVTLRLSRDPGDDKFLECAVAGRADYAGHDRERRYVICAPGRWTIEAVGDCTRPGDVGDAIRGATEAAARL